MMSVPSIFATAWVRRAMMLGALCALSACATGPNSLARDPYEASNRQVFNFNEGLDSHVLKPAAQAYDAVMPDPVQNAVDNFTNNIKDVWSLANLVLQGEGASAVYELMRIGVNTTFGIAGLVDVATDLRLDRHNEDLGQTLAVWGASSGPYLVLPVFGPSTVRDAVALPFDQYVMPPRLFSETRDSNAMRAVQLLNTRAKFLTAGDLLNDAALDKYAFVRDAYLQRRKNMIYNGEPPEEDVEDASLSWPADDTLISPQVKVPQRLTERLPVRVDTSVFWDDWSAEVVLPTLPADVTWKTVSAH